ncbi:hypothetical protein [Nannocystis punicea]|uniref:Uncharacterized protein n=1 Tax=Nannocystis punicea TaxID=2995304 RepID=A0ABY7H953_9BACT|nr:hypothetical protein [Nannocystis poenicansa]WAS95805.1 hypothetical protein O0S08_06545 [Nannocystis poenicansa]
MTWRILELAFARGCSYEWTEASPVGDRAARQLLEETGSCASRFSSSPVE